MQEDIAEGQPSCVRYNQSLKLTEITVYDFAARKNIYYGNGDISRTYILQRTGSTSPQLSSGPLGGIILSLQKKGKAMKCPKCNQTPMPFLRFLFSTKGVGLKRAIQGQLLCEKCHSTLRTRSGSLGFRFWIVTIFFILLFVIEALAVNQLVAFLGFTLTAVVYIITILATGFCGSFLEWKYVELEQVQSGNAA